jgi:two-component system chemotaxis response regulator CheY
MAKILVVDDSSFMRTMLKNILLENKHEIIGEASGGKDAIEKYKTLKPDLVTMDMIMADMNGIDVVKEIIQLDANAKVVMVSAMGQQILMDEAIKAGVKDFIIKPFQEEKVKEVIAKVLGTV